MAASAKAKAPFPRGFLRLPNGHPNHGTFGRLFRLLDPDKSAVAFQHFMAFSRNCQRAIARQIVEQGGNDPLALKENQKPCTTTCTCS